MKNRKLRIFVETFLFLLLILSIRSWDFNLAVHIMGGIAFAFLSSAHVFINRKWLVSVSKSFKTGSLKQKTKRQYILDLLILADWSVAILSGFPAMGFALGGMESLFAFSRIHGVSSRLGCVLIIAHIFQHRKQIGSYIKRKKLIRNKQL